MKHLLWKRIVVLMFLALSLMSGNAWADQIALSFSGGGTWVWPGATIGWEFSISEPVTVTYLGVWDDNGDGLAENHDVGIWLSSGGAPLVTAVVTTSDPLTDGFRYTPITPTTLQPGTYVIGSYMPSGSDLGAADASYSTQLPVTYERNLFLYDSGFTIPTEEWVGYDGGNFGPNFQFVSAAAIPTMNEWGMIIFAILAGIGAVYYLRKYKRI
jgi:hypothetical protein